MPSQKLEQKLSLVQSDDITTAFVGSVPVILINSSRPQGAIVKAVNFVRNGCHEVQLCFERAGFDQYGKKLWIDTASNLLDNLGVGKERLFLAAPDGEESLYNSDVIFLRRKV